MPFSGDYDIFSVLFKTYVLMIFTMSSYLLEYSPLISNKAFTFFLLLTKKNNAKQLIV